VADLTVALDARLTGDASSLTAAAAADVEEGPAAADGAAAVGEDEAYGCGDVDVRRS